MPSQPTIARIWRGRTRPEIADQYEAHLRAEGIPPLQTTALGVQLLREDRDNESWFTTISYWPDMESMTAFTQGSPTKVHHLRRDAEPADRITRACRDPSHPARRAAATLIATSSMVHQ